MWDTVKIVDIRALMHCIQATDSNLDIQLKWHDISADTDISMRFQNLWDSH